MTDNITTSVCFTGHRTIEATKVESLKTQLHEIIENLYKEGHRSFYCGMAIGFDLLAAETLIGLKASYPDIHLTACIPFIGQESRYSAIDQKRYHKALTSADTHIIISHSFSKQSYLLRNIYMLEHSSIVIAYFDCSTKKGGTYFTYNKAMQMGKEVRNIF